jgi:hypothetical protein
MKHKYMKAERRKYNLVLKGSLQSETWLMTDERRYKKSSFSVMENKIK